MELGNHKCLHCAFSFHLPALTWSPPKKCTIQTCTCLPTITRRNSLFTADRKIGGQKTSNKTNSDENFRGVQNRQRQIFDSSAELFSGSVIRCCDSSPSHGQMRTFRTNRLFC